MTSSKHACFLREPRTDVVVGEPRYDLPVVQMLKVFLPQEMNRVGVSITRSSAFSSLTISFDRNSSSHTRDQRISCLDATASSKRLHCTRTQTIRRLPPTSGQYGSFLC